MVQEQLKRKNLLIVAPMGSGKTLSTLSTLTALVYQEAVENVIIVGTKRVANSVWVQEAREYNMPLNIRFCETALDMKLFLLEPANHRIMVVSVTRIDEAPNGCWDAVIMDESTLFGNQKSNRSQEAQRICKRVPRRYELTGTPIHGGYEKLFHQIFLLDGGRALGKSITAYRQKYMYVKYKVHGVTEVWDVREEMIEELTKAIAHLVYVVKDNVELPDCLYKNIYVDLPPNRRKEYDEFESSSIISFHTETGKKHYDEDVKTLIAFASSSRGMKLRQLASGCVYTEQDYDVNGKAKTYTVTHTEKIEALRDLVDSMERGILVAYQFKSEYEALKKAFPTARRLDKPEDIKDWNDGKIDIALVHPQSAGHGLNLQRGGNMLVWYSLVNCDAELYAQLNKRLHRSGQKDTVSIVHLLARNTIDEKLLHGVNVKLEKANDFEKYF